MIKVLLIDGDGILINKPLLFSEHFSRDYHIPMELILPFFKNEFQDCLIGKRDLKEAIQPYLSKWEWNKSIDELLQYWFRSENYIDTDIVELIYKYRKQGIKCYLHSNQEKYRTDYMIKNMGLGEVVDGVFSSAYLGVKKPSQEFWKLVLEKIIPVSKSEILVWDDDEENVASARQFGLHSEFYENHDSFIKKMKEYFT